MTETSGLVFKTKWSRQRIDGARISNKRILKEIEESGLSQNEYLNLKYGSFAIPEPDNNIHNNDNANNNN